MLKTVKKHGKIENKVRKQAGNKWDGDSKHLINDLMSKYVAIYGVNSAFNKSFIG